MPDAIQDAQARPDPAQADLAAMQWVADPHADEAVAAVLGPWPAHGEVPAAEFAARVRRIDELNAAMRSWQDNAHVASWRAGAGDSAIGPALERYVAAARSLPSWAEPERVLRAEKLFMDYGALSVTLLFCASLPECYVIPDLAAVLHATGQLEDRAEHRIRTTGAMVFPVMMLGGLTRPGGSGIAQILKVRLIHATIRNLVLRASPPEALARMRSTNDSTVVAVPPLAAIQPTDSMPRALYVHGWDLERLGLPNNQEELAYTLLTFSYVFLRGMRKLRIPFSGEEERDYLHAWNVAGHFLGIDRSLMAETMEEAEALFARMQERGRADWEARPAPGDPRHRLGRALMEAMKSAIPDGPFKSFPVLLTRFLVGRKSSRDLGLDEQVSAVSRGLFVATMLAARGIDALVRLAVPGFSIARFITRAIGYRLTCVLLMSQTRELSVPSTLRPGIRSVVANWGEDRQAPRWVNALEDRLTTPGDWHPR